MGLTIKDFITTLCAAGVGFVFYAQTQGMKLPVISNYRMASLIVLIIGFFMCAFGSRVTYPVSASNPVAWIIGILGFVVLAIGILGIITGNKVIFGILAGTILFMWLVTTVRHLFVK
jgi:hypothetical protein